MAAVNDIFVLYKQTESKKSVDKFRKGLSEKFEDLTIRDYDDSFPEESEYESTCSSVLLCLIDDEWFYDPHCREIWKCFWNKQINSCHQQVIFPVLINNINTDNFDEEKLSIYEDAQLKLGFYDISNSDSGDIKELYVAVESSIKAIEKNSHDQNAQFSSRGGRRNTHKVYEIEKTWVEEIKNINENSECPRKRLTSLSEIITRLKFKLEEAYNKIEDTERSYPDKEKVCVVYTGGTAGMIFDPLEKESLELKQADLQHLIIKLPRLKREQFEIDFYSFNPALDSSNIGSEHWLLIAAVIEILSKYYKGFVIIHGTNTMAYTASAISFLFDDTANKPIVLTGSELALTERNSDAEQNIHRSIEIAAQKDTSDVQGVCILFGKWLLRGNRTTKQIALDKAEGFYSPNYREIASVSSDKVHVDLSHIKKQETNRPFSMNKFISSIPKVAICDIYPDMDMNALITSCTSHEVKAVILRTYGTGGVPNQDPNFEKCLQKLQKTNTIVVNLTQCPKGTSEFRLFETNEMLFNYGVISGGDMVTEAAYCKLKHLFSKFSSVKDDEEKIRYIKHYMMVAIQGEMSRSMFVVDIPINNTLVTKSEPSTLHLKPTWSNNPAANADVYNQNLDVDSFAKLEVDKDYITSAVLRLGKVRLPENVGTINDFNLKTKVSILKNEDESCNINNTTTHGIKFSGKAGATQDVNIDIIEIVKTQLKPAEGAVIKIKAEVREFYIESVKILLSTIRR